MDQKVITTVLDFEPSQDHQHQTLGSKKQDGAFFHNTAKNVSDRRPRLLTKFMKSNSLGFSGIRCSDPKVVKHFPPRILT